MSEHQAYTYYAFVSYSHKDEKWGKWIQSALEHYRLPAVVRKEVGKPLPQKIHPVFRDDTDLGACRLEAGLQQELEQSRFLIVVCSPNSAKPNAEGRHWVNEEVKRFCDMGRTDNVIPVIVEGTKETSFCPKLAEINNIGPDATKQSKARVLNNLVAKILGLRPDELWRREERRLRAKRCWRAFAASLAASIVAFGGYVWWDSTRTVTRAFADYVDSYGLPEGIFPLTPEQVSHRHVHYRFEFRGYRYGKSIHADSSAPSLLRGLGFQRILRRVIQSTSCENPTGNGGYLLQSSRSAIQIFNYDQEGPFLANRLKEIRHGLFFVSNDDLFLIKREEFYNEGTGTNNLTKVYRGKGQLDIGYSPSASTERNRDMNPDIMHSWQWHSFKPTKSDISVFDLIRDKQGRINKCIFRNNSGGITADADGIFGKEYEYDHLGRKTAEWNLGVDGNNFSRRSDNQGIAGLIHEYKEDNHILAKYVNSHGNPVLGPFGWMIREGVFDEFGNIIQLKFLDSFGHLRLNGRHNGIQEQFNFNSALNNITYDDRGYVTSISFFDTKGRSKLVNIQAGSIDGIELPSDYYFNKMASKVVFSRDDNGNLLKETYFDADGIEKESILFCHDRFGHITQASFFNGDHSPQVIGLGWHWTSKLKRKSEAVSVCYLYDNFGRPIKEWYLNSLGRMVPYNDMGLFYKTWKYNTQGNLIKMSFINEDGSIRESTEYDYDLRGNTIGERHFGERGTPVVELGRFETKWQYDEAGRVIRESYYDISGAPVCPAKFSCDQVSMEWEYTKDGHISKTSYIDKDGVVTSQTIFRYNDSGQVIVVADTIVYSGRASKARTEYAYDSRGNKTRVARFGIDGLPCNNSDGCSIEEYEYNDQNLPTKVRFYDLQGNLAPCVYGYCGWDITYDSEGREIQRTRIGPEGIAAVIDGGCAQIRYTYDSYGRCTSIRYFGTDGNLMMIMPGYFKSQCAGYNYIYESDSDGLVRDEVPVGIDGLPIHP